MRHIKTEIQDWPLRTENQRGSVKVEGLKMRGRVP